MSSPGEHKKKHEHKKKSLSLPPNVLPDGGLKSRIHGVPGSTPGCTAGAYAKTLDPENLPDITLKTCFPEQYAVAKKWLGDVHPKTLQLLLAGFGPEPTIADIVNKWLIRRVGRKCIEGTEEGRKDLEAFCVDLIKRLRKLPPVAMKLYRAVPWSAMGKSAPGLSEFEEETNIVWPTFTSLVKNEKFAKDMLKEEGGILFVVDAEQARDVSEYAVAAPDMTETEYLLEPNSVFTISANKHEDKIFVVEMKQTFPSVRPIMKEVEERKHHHHHDSVRGVNSDPVDCISPPMSPSLSKGDRSSTVITPVIRRVPTMSATPISRKNSLPVLEGFSSSTPGSPRSFARSSSRLAIPMSPHGKTRPKHRVQVSTHTPSMTMWSAARGYIKVLSSQSRKKVKPLTPSWATDKPKEEKKEEEETKQEEGENEPDKKKDKEKKKKKKEKKEKEKEEDSGLSVETTKVDTADDKSPLSPTTPGFGTMVLCPYAAPTYIIDDRTVDMQTLGGIILHSTRGTPLIVMSLH